MVSLQPNVMSTGAQYMDEEEGSGPGSNDIEPILSSTDDGSIKKLRTIPVVSIHLIISIIITCVFVALKTIWQHEETLFIMTCLRIFFWIITFEIDRMLRKRHNELRMNGYHDFHRSITKHNGVAFHIVSGWNSLILMAISTLYAVKKESILYVQDPLTAVLILQVVETCILLLIITIYIIEVNKFNKAEYYPDALRGSNSSAGSLGLMQPDGNVSELLEKQADLIAYLKDHNQTLNQKLHQIALSRGWNY